VTAAPILAIENGWNVRREAGVENFLGVGDPCRDTGRHFGVFKSLESFVLGHARILAQPSAQV
jgi:hypothetical protein